MIGTCVVAHGNGARQHALTMDRDGTIPPVPHRLTVSGACRRLMGDMRNNHMNADQKEAIVETGRIAIPSIGDGGMDGQRSGHFGHCDVFTLIDVENCEVRKVSTIRNQEHVQGGCMEPVNLLAEHKVDALIVGGIGMRPLMAFRQAGIDVYHEAEEVGIEPVVYDLVYGRLPVVTDDKVCGGGAMNVQ